MLLFFWTTGDRDVFFPSSGLPHFNSKDVQLDLPVDNEDYLVPSPCSCNSAGYMDLVGDAKISSPGNLVYILY